MSRAGDVLLLEVSLEISALFTLAEPGRPAAREVAQIGLIILIQQFECLVGSRPWHFVDPLVRKVFDPAGKDDSLSAERFLCVVSAWPWPFGSVCVEDRDSANQLDRASLTSLPRPMAMAFFLLTSN